MSSRMVINDDANLLHKCFANIPEGNMAATANDIIITIDSFNCNHIGHPSFTAANNNYCIDSGCLRNN